MDESQAAIWFVGDLNDAWVASIADALPVAHGVVRIQCTGELMRGPLFAADHPPRLIVVHRQTLAPVDAQWLKDWRPDAVSTTSPALILCVGPYVRYEELERYSGLVDLVLSEATAADVIPRHVVRLLDGRPTRMPRADTDPPVRVLVASTSTNCLIRSPRRVPQPGIPSNESTTRRLETSRPVATSIRGRAKRSSQSGMFPSSRNGPSD